MIETLDDIIEGLADKFMIYGAHPEDTDLDGPLDVCRCRVCWTSNLKARIERAVEIAAKLANNATV